MTMDGITLYTLALVAATLIAAWVVTAEWRADLRYHRIVRKRLRQIVRHDRGFARGLL